MRERVRVRGAKLDDLGRHFQTAFSLPSRSKLALFMLYHWMDKQQHRPPRRQRAVAVRMREREEQK